MPKVVCFLATPKAAYFHVANGLRGRYMPDSAFVVRVTTRRELRAIIAGECAAMRDAHGFGGSQKDIAATVAALAFSRRYQQAGGPADDGRTLPPNIVSLRFFFH